MRFDGIKRVFALAVAITVAAALVFGTVIQVAADTKVKQIRASSRRLTEDQKIIHLLNRLGYGPRPGEVERIKRFGVDKYIDQQLHPERIDDAAAEARLAGLDSLRMTLADVYDKYPSPAEVARELGLLRQGQADPNAPGSPSDDPEAKENQREMRRKVFAYYAEKGLKPPQRLLQELQAQKLLRAAYSERQLQEVMSDFWFNHFNIFWGKGADRWLTTDFEMNAIRPHTLGKFKQVLLATAKSPAMLFYLDNFQSSSPDAQIPGRRGGRGRGLFQNRAGQMTDEQRRRPQVANQLRNRKRGINENYARELMELHTLGVDGGYTQKDVQEVARAFTGWSIEQPRQSGEFVFRQWMHDDGEKVVLGQRLPAGGGMKDGETVIDILARHPNTAKFIATKLARRFVSDDPPSSLVDRVAGVYLKTDGDIREMLKTIFASDEFFSAESYRAKIKSPFELAVSAIRALGGDTTGTYQLPQFIARMGQPLYLYQPPTGYPDRAEQWVNTGALLERLNFGLALSANRVRGTSVNLKRVAQGREAADPAPAMDRAIALLLNGDVSPQTRAVLDKQLKEGVPVAGELDQPGRDTMSAGEMAPDEMVRDLPAGEGGRQGQGRRARLGGRFNDGMAQAALSPVEAEIAKVYGLVLGSPEFQRR